MRLLPRSARRWPCRCPRWTRSPTRPPPGAASPDLAVAIAVGRVDRGTPAWWTERSCGSPDRHDGQRHDLLGQIDEGAQFVPGDGGERRERGAIPERVG